MRKLHVPLLLGLVLVVGCMSDDQKTRLEQQASTPLSCLPGGDCNAKWRRAREWVEDNSHFPILRANDKEIVTDSSDNTLYPVVSVHKRPREDGDESEYVILFTAECENLIGCVPTELQVEASFTDYVNGTPSQPEIDNDIELGATFGAAAGKSSGIPILAVTAGSPAQAAGWQAGDKLMKFNGRTVSAGGDVDGMVADTQPGSVFPVQIMRGGRTIVTYMRL